MIGSCVFVDGVVEVIQCFGAFSLEIRKQTSLLLRSAGGGGWGIRRVARRGGVGVARRVSLSRRRGIRRSATRIWRGAGGVRAWLLTILGALVDVIEEILTLSLQIGQNAALRNWRR